MTLSPGKLQRTGVRTAVAERRVLSHAGSGAGSHRGGRAPDLGHRDAAPTPSSRRSRPSPPATTSDRGQPLLRTVYSPEMNAAAAQLIAQPASATRAPRRRLENLEHLRPRSSTRSSASRKVPIDHHVVGAPRRRSAASATPSDGMKRQVRRHAVQASSTIREGLGPRRHHRSATWRQRPRRAGRHDRRPCAPGRFRIAYLHWRGRTRDLPAPRTMATRVTPACGSSCRNPNGDAAARACSPTSTIATGDRQAGGRGARRRGHRHRRAKQVVLLDRGVGRFEPQGRVRLGTRGDGYVEIPRRHRRPATRVVTSANFLIDAESNLKAALQGLSEPQARSRPAGRRPRGSDAMISRVSSPGQRGISMLVLIGTVFAVASGRLYALKTLPLDAIPDLSDVQTIVYTEYPGSGAPGHRGPGHLPADHRDADGAEGRRSCAASRSSGSRSSTSSSRTAPTRTGPARRVLEYLNTVAKQACRPA